MKPCKRCGRRETTNDERLCFDCEYWQDVAERAAVGEPIVVVDGRCYVIQPPPADYPCFLGFEGERFVIWFQSGHTVETNNLWYLGPVPVQFRRRLADIARFFGQEPLFRSGR
jgi:hypothetical protein